MSLKNALGGIALIAGTAIGAAVLALPIATAHLGLWSSLLIYGVCWFFMLMGALYLLEANLMVGYGINLFTMAEKTLGAKGKYATLAIYLILLYALTAAYLAGAGAWIKQLSQPFSLSPFSAACLATLLTMVIIWMGTAFTDWINRFLMIGLIGAFGTLIFATYPHIDTHLLFSQPLIGDVKPIPLIITAFGSAIVIPTLTDYLHGKPKQLLMVVLIGSCIPLLVYVLWELAILGTIPLHGSPGLIEMQHHGQPAVDLSHALEKLLQSHQITLAAAYFSIFALLTSLIGVSLSLFDFLADGLHLKKNFRGKVRLSLVTFVPPLIFLLISPEGFMVALSFAGIFVSLLLGILPALMIWRGRYQLALPSPLKVPGGKYLLIVTMLFFMLAASIEAYYQLSRLWAA